MSSIQANNLPESESATDACRSESPKADVEDPDPASVSGDEADPLTDCGGGASHGDMPENVSTIQLDVTWDDCVQERGDLSAAMMRLSPDRMAAAVNAAADYLGYRSGRIGILVTDDPTIHALNVRHLGHDYPTDVISFPYSESDDWIEGELVASLDTAGANAVEAGWATEDEFLLYVIHGVLHIGGMDDHEQADRAAMRKAEKAVLVRLGMNPDPAAERVLSAGSIASSDRADSDKAEGSGRD